MTRTTRKFIAVLMLLWLPVFTGNALAASVSMQLPQGGCHEAAMSHDAMDMGEHAMHHDEMPSPGGAHSACGVCLLACSAYLAVPGTTIAAVQTGARETTPYLLAYRSITFAPLVPPPLVRA